MRQCSEVEVSGDVVWDWQEGERRSIVPVDSAAEDRSSERHNTGKL